ncbi:MAG: hypothetical protein V3U24_04240 [Candidatus Neomarinimicrobiota bacterium]
MDFNYWIILIVIYLISQWVRRRIRGRKPRQAREPVPHPAEGEEEKGEKGLPEWFRELGLLDLEEEEMEPPPAPEIPPMEPEEEVAHLIPEEEPPSPEPAVGELQRTAPGKKESIPGGPYGDLIYNPESLRDFIVIREILGPPRSIHRFSPRAR